jgi:hypothetical protein
MMQVPTGPYKIIGTNYFLRTTAFTQWDADWNLQAAYFFLVFVLLAGISRDDAEDGAMLPFQKENVKVWNCML